MQNGWGGKRSNPVAEWMAFDALPYEVRRVIDEAPAKFSSENVLREWRKAKVAGWSAQRFADYVADAIEKTLAAREVRTS